MEYLNQHLSLIKNQIKKVGNCVLFLDFDGTISPIVNMPNKARLPQKTRQNIINCLKYFPVVIVSGRELCDVKQRVGIKGLIYAGNHGLEWQIGKRYYCAKISDKKINLIKMLRNEFRKVLSRYPGAFLEDKRLAVAIHYRMVRKSQIQNFKKEVKRIIEFWGGKDLFFIDDKMTFDVRPKLDWTKANFVELILKYLQSKQKKLFSPIYIGDAATDEDVFAMFKNKNMVTIRVGDSKNSPAKYYIENQGQVDNFLVWLAKLN